jgi:hypothetical protein
VRRVSLRRNSDLYYGHELFLILLKLLYPEILAL